MAQFSTIEKLPEILKLLEANKDPTCRKLNENLFGLYEIKIERGGQLDLPSPLMDRVKQDYSKEVLDKIVSQIVFQMLNKWTYDSSNCNPLRAIRTKVGSSTEQLNAVKKQIEEKRDNCDFCKAINFTAVEDNKRVKTSYSITGSNMFKINGINGLVLPNKHSIFDINLEEFLDTFNTTVNFFRQYLDTDFEYPIWLWDQGFHAGASQVHMHVQAFLDENKYLGKYGALDRAAESYLSSVGQNYFQDLIQAHETLGLAVKFHDVYAIVPLTSHKDHEVMIIAEKPSKYFFTLFYLVIQTYINELGVYCWSSSGAFPRLNKPETGLPSIIKVGSRGDCSSVRSDVGGLELYLFYSINVDPISTINSLKKTLRNFLKS